MKLRPHQLKAVQESPDKWGLWFRQRVGKTGTAIMLANTRIKSCLVISPKQIKDNWEREVLNWEADNCRFYFCTKEDVRLGKNIPETVDGIIVDEAHMAFGNFKSKAYKALYKYINSNNVKCVWLLTGTPMTATNWCVYSYGILLGKQWNFVKWREHFNFPIKMGRRVIWKEKPGIQAELQEILKSIGTVIDLKDIADVPDDEDQFEYFDINKEQKKLIEDSFDPMPSIRYCRQHQIESGIFIGDKYNEGRYVACDKDKRILSLAESNDKIVIIARYILQIEKYRELLKDCGKRIFVISGKEKMTATQTAGEAENSDKAIVLIQGDTVAGYNLQSFDLVVFASMSYSFVNYDQVRFRTKNMDKSTACCYVHLITKGDSIDKAVYESVKNKQNFSEELYGRRKEGIK